MTSEASIGRVATAMTRRGFDGEGRSGETKMAASLRSEQAVSGGAVGAAAALEEGAALGAGDAAEECELAAGELDALGDALGDALREGLGEGEGGSTHAVSRAAASATRAARNSDRRARRGMS
jgi:hypothetical protein